MKRKGSALESSSSTSSDTPGSEAAARGPRGVDSPQFHAGRLGKPNGLDGFIGLYVEPQDLVYFTDKSIVYIQDRPYTVRAVRRGKKGHQVQFVEVTSRDGAESIRGNDVYVAERRTLGDGEYWPDDLVGLAVRPGGGNVSRVIYGLAQDRLVVDRDGSTFEVPFVHDLVPNVNIDDGYVEIVEIEGLSSLSD